MAPILSKVKTDPEKLRPEDATKVAARKARPFIDSLIELIEAALATGGVMMHECSESANYLGRLADKVVHGAAHLLQGLCCLDLQKFTRGPEKPALQSQLPVFFVLGLLAMLYNAFVFAYMPAAGLAFNSPESMIFHSFVFLTLASFAQAARTDPGGIPPTKEWRDPANPPRAASDRKKFSNDPRWCRKSQAFKPDRAHFCRAMGRVVLRMDHHCPWLGNTVGWANHKFFFLFLVYTSAACTMLNISFIELLVNATLPALTKFLLIGAEALSFLLSSILVPFLFFHTWLLIRNMTTIEFCASFTKTGSQEDQTSENPYDMGIYSNLCSVLGSSPLSWWAPVGGPEGDGISFSRKGGENRKHEDPEAAHPEYAGSGTGDDEETPKKEDCSSFLVWKDAAEFSGDLRLGCEVIVDSAEDAATRTLSFCTGRFKRRKQASRRSNRSNFKLVPMENGGSDLGSDWSTSSAVSRESMASQGADFV